MKAESSIVKFSPIFSKIAIVSPAAAIPELKISKASVVPALETKGVADLKYEIEK